MTNRRGLGLNVSALILMFVSGSANGADGPGADAAAGLKKLIVDGVAAGSKPAIYLEVFGAASRVVVVGADDKGVIASTNGTTIPLAWAELSPKYFGNLAGEFTKTGADHLMLVRYYADHDLADRAEKAALAAIEEDKNLAAEVGALLAQLKPAAASAAAPQAPSASSASSAASGSKDAEGTAVPEHPNLAAMTGMGSAPANSSTSGRALPPLPRITAPIMFDTPEADAVCAAMQIFPRNSAWNEDISALPVHPDSDKIVAFIGANKNLHTDYGANFIIVPPDQPKVDVKALAYPRESDKGPFPVPDNAPIEGWPAWWEKKVSLDEMQRVGDGDRHCSIVDPVNDMLYEFYQMRKTPAGWVCGCTATWDLKANKLRTKGWTSADAAGLPLFPGYIRYDDIQRGIVEHAMRMTVEVTRKACVYPATHIAGATDSPYAPAMGQRLRLKANADISKLPKEAQAVARGLKKYGAIIADNGGDWDFGFTLDKRFNDAAVKALRTLKGSDMEVVQNTGEHDPPRQ